VYAWDFRADLGGRWSSQARGRLGLGTVRDAESPSGSDAMRIPLGDV